MLQIVSPNAFPHLPMVSLSHTIEASKCRFSHSTEFRYSTSFHSNEPFEDRPKSRGLIILDTGGRWPSQRSRRSSVNAGLRSLPTASCAGREAPPRRLPITSTKSLLYVFIFSPVSARRAMNDSMVSKAVLGLHRADCRHRYLKIGKHFQQKGVEPRIGLVDFVDREHAACRLMQHIIETSIIYDITTA